MEALLTPTPTYIYLYQMTYIKWLFVPGERLNVRLYITEIVKAGSYSLNQTGIVNTTTNIKLFIIYVHKMNNIKLKFISWFAHYIMCL